VAEPQREMIEPAPGCGSREAALFLSQLQAKRAELIQHTRGLGPEELAWQPAPGMNTIGMLLAHIAIVEVYWTQIGLLVQPQDIPAVLAIGEYDDGMPIAQGAGPPALLDGKTLAHFDELLRRSSDYSRGTIAGLTDADLDRTFERRWRSGEESVINLRWVLYHMIEHEAGHHAQINLLRHHARVAGVGAAGKA
jgi:uncharacterized damage-inducible protein DinB